MSVVQKGRMTSPVHVHVDEQTPVHVHIKQPKKATVNGNDVSFIQILTLTLSVTQAITLHCTFVACVQLL